MPKKVRPSRYMRLAEDVCNLSREIIRYANRGTTRVDFACQVTSRLREFTGVDAVELWIDSPDEVFRCESDERSAAEEMSPSFTSYPRTRLPADLSAFKRMVLDWLWAMRQGLPLHRRWIPDAADGFGLDLGDREVAVGEVKGGYRSIALLPFTVEDAFTGVVILKARAPRHAVGEVLEFYEGIAHTLGLAVDDRRAQATLRERVKELDCLYQVAQIIDRPDLSLETAIVRVLNLLPPAWLYPEIASARVLLDGKTYRNDDYREAAHWLRADIVAGGDGRGCVEVGYRESRPAMYEGPFLKEERTLLDAVARHIAVRLERTESANARAELEDQLRHADRLATLGQLAAGVAHELNEPLGTILGFAQLAQAADGVTEAIKGDLGKIVKSALHAREVIRKLVLFARQAPAERRTLDLNDVMEEGLYFFEARCAKEGIRLERFLAPDLPAINGDAPQIHQVLVNLVVNAIHAMPGGGTLTIATQKAASGDVTLQVIDTGVGIDPDVQRRIFEPFFTTKDVDEGTGLGLAVVHGIVMAHKGSIAVRSKPGEGTTFTVTFPCAADSPE